MIVSASYKTDIPAFYGPWFRARLAASAARVRNPYGGKPFEVSLAPGDADAFVFWTRNAGPFADALDDVAERGFPFTVQFTVTGYPAALDAATIPAEAAVSQIRALRAHWGPRAVVWRYDPVVFTDPTPADWHADNFARLAAALRGAVDEVVVSVAQIYRKTARNLDRAAAAHGFSWRDPDADEKRALLARLVEIGGDHGMALTLCGQPELAGGGVAEARCIDADRLSDVAGRVLAVSGKAHRATCRCAPSRDIGAYDSCPHGCAYCYAVSSRDAAKRALARHDPAGEFLLPARTGPRGNARSPARTG